MIKNPSKYFVLLDVRLAEFDPSDIRGIPNLETNGAVEWKPPLWVYFISREKARGIVFLDECNLAPPSVQSAFYQLILDREVGELSVSDGIYLLSAGNREGKDRANVYTMSAPLRNRFTHITLRIPHAGAKGNWTNWALNNGIDDRIVGFLSTPLGEDKLFTFDGRKERKVFATPRSWEFTSDLIKGLEDRDFIRTVVSSSVGEGTATEFVGFLEMQDKVDLDGLLENPEKIKKLDEHENAVDLKFSVVAGLSSEYKNRKKVLRPLVKVANELDNNGDTEFGILMLRLAKRHHPTHFNKITEMKEWDNLSEKFSQYLL